MDTQLTDDQRADVVFSALAKWIKQRSRLDYANYGEIQPYRSDARQVAADGQRARKALALARELRPARYDCLIDSFRAFSGRLEWRACVDRAKCVAKMCTCHDDTAWTANAYPHGCSCGCAWQSALRYTTGQYWPTEYRKASSAVLETYIAAWKQAENAANPRTFTYETIDDVISANESIGNHFFSPSTMRFFKCRIESRLIAGHRFVTSEQGPDGIRKYTIRDAKPDGTIDTAGEFQAYASKKAAMRDILKDFTLGASK